MQEKANEIENVLRALDRQRLGVLRKELECLPDIQRRLEVRRSFGKLAYLLIILL